MSTWFFFLRSYIKRPVMWICSALVILLAVFAFSTGHFRHSLPCAVYSEDPSKEASDVLDYLQGTGFAAAGSAEELYEMVKTGKADTGILLVNEFSEYLEEGNLSKSAVFVISERSMRVHINKLMGAVAIYQELQPYLTAITAAKYGYDASAQDISAYREIVVGMTNPLYFEIVSVDGALDDVTDNYDLAIGIVIISCFVVIGFICAGPVRRNSRKVRQRFSGFGQFYLKCMLPQCASVGAIAAISGLAGFLISALFLEVPLADIILPFIITMAVMTVFFSLFSCLPVSDHLLVCIIAVDAALSLVLCPLYSATNLLGGYIGPFRFLSLPYLMFALMQL